MKKTKALTEKESLQLQLKKIAEAEHKAIIEANWPIISQHIGKFFKYRNSYGGSDKKDWWLYKKITSIKPENIYTVADGGASAHIECYSFQTDCYGDISIQQKKHDYLHNSGQEITEREFNEAWNKMIEALSKLK